jgi:hypothetical protein
MALKDRTRLSKEETAKINWRHGRGDLTEYHEAFAELEPGESHKYELEEGQKSMTERARWVSVAQAAGFNFKFSVKKDVSTGQTTATIAKGDPLQEQAQTPAKSSKKGS